MTDNIFSPEDDVDYSNSFIEDLERKVAEDTSRVGYNMKVPLFDERTNPNHAIFVTPTQAGHDDDDQGHGSIGDAVAQHITSMLHRLPEMQSFIHMSNGNIFRLEENVAAPDEDGRRRIGKEIAEVMTATTNASEEEKEALVAFFRQEIEDNKKRREEKNDALDHPNVPYEDWETKPQMTREWDIPATPKPLFIYCGTSSQAFYDYFPENHPDAAKLNGFIAMVKDIDIDDFDDFTCQYFIDWIENQAWKVPTVADHLVKFCEEITPEKTYKDPTDAMEEALMQIDQEWGQVSSNAVVKRFKDTPVAKEMIRFYEHNKALHAKGELMWGKIGKLGKSLFSLAGAPITAAHWGMYFRLKKEFAPRLLLENVDLNRAGVGTMECVLAKTKSKDEAKKIAKKIFFERPFMRLNDLVERGYITTNDIVGNKNTAVFISMIKQGGRSAITSGNMYNLGKVAQNIVDYQRRNPNKLQDDEWALVWQAYKICKKECENFFNK